MKPSIIVSTCICRIDLLLKWKGDGVYLDTVIAYTKKELSEYDTLVKQMAIYLEKVKLFEQSEEDRRLNQDILNTVQEGIQLIGTERNIIQVN